MGKSKYNNFIKKYDTIRSVLRDMYIYGCYSREDFDNKKISGRKYDNEKRRILFYIKSEYIDETNNDDNSKYVRLVYDMYRCTNNFLADSFLTKSFNKNDIVLFFIIQQVLNKHNEVLSIQEIMDKIIISLPESMEEYTESTVRRKLKRLTDDGMLMTINENNKKIYRITDDFFGKMTDVEIIELLDATKFYMNVSSIRLPGFYLLETIFKYLKYHRNIVVEECSVFMFKNNHLQRIIDDEVITKIVDCIVNRRRFKFIYGDAKTITECVPLKIIIDSYYGRQYLFAANCNTLKPIIYRIDRILEAAEGGKVDKKCRIEDYEKYIDKSWCATFLDEEKGLVKVEVEYVIDEDKQIYIIDRLRREGKWGIIEKIEIGKYLYTIEVSDPIELIPWIRSFTGFATVRESKEHNLNERLAYDCKEALRNYGVI